MFVRIHGTKDYVKGNTQSCNDLVNYLEKENEGKEFLELEQFFSHTSESVDPNYVINSIDNNKKGLKDKDAKFFMVTINPSERELKHLARMATNGKEITDISQMNSKEIERYNQYLKIYARDVMDNYAKGFNRGISGKDLVYYGKLEQERHYRGTDKEVSAYYDEKRHIALTNEIKKVQQQISSNNIEKNEQLGEVSKEALSFDVTLEEINRNLKQFNYDLIHSELENEKTKINEKYLLIEADIEAIKQNISSLEMKCNGLINSEYNEIKDWHPVNKKYNKELIELKELYKDNKLTIHHKTVNIEFRRESHLRGVAKSRVLKREPELYEELSQKQEELKNQLFLNERQHKDEISQIDNQLRIARGQDFMLSLTDENTTKSIGDTNLNQDINQFNELVKKRETLESQKNEIIQQINSINSKYDTIGHHLSERLDQLKDSVQDMNVLKNNTNTENCPKVGDKKPGLQSHVHIVVSRKDKTQKMSLSPLANSRGKSDKHKLNGKSVQVGFDRVNFKLDCEHAFDKAYNFKRNFDQSFEYYKFRSNPTKGLTQSTRMAKQATQAVKNPGMAAKNIAIAGIDNLTNTKIAGNVSTATNLVKNPESAKDLLVGKLDQVLNKMLPPEVKAAKKVLEVAVKIVELGSGGLEI